MDEESAPSEPDHVSSPNAWIELLHAEVGYLLRTAGVPVLHIKGPTVVSWLYEPDGRPWGDVDVLVPPSRLHDALGVLAEHGFVERYAGVNRRTSDDHAIAIRRLDPRIGLDEVDVHDRFEGLTLDPERAFAVLWRRREPARLAHVDVWFPDLTSRALIVAVNTARSPRSAQAREDLARLVVEPPLVAWDEVRALARQLGALSALKAGLGLADRGSEIIAAAGLEDIVVDPEWALRLSGAPRTAVRWAQLGGIPWGRRPRTVLGWILPPAPVVRMREQQFGYRDRGLVFGHIRRWRDGARALPGALRSILATRRH